MMRDIRFTGHTTLENCESEPIHVPGTIQPHGVLLALDTTTFIIDFCSANTVEFLGLEVKEVVGKSLEDVIGKEECDKIAHHLKENSFEQFYTLNYKAVLFSTSLFHQGNQLLLEMERFPDNAMSLPDLYQQSRNFIGYMENGDGLKGLCSHLVDEIREVTGYDRVMVYRFDKAYNGEVYAESLNDNIEPFLGLHYPHTDIPPQARALFERNLLRMIPDVNYEPVAVMTLSENATHRSLDMGPSGLRSVSPIHIEYLKNMGVGATLTISLIHNKKLWGLIACHHYSPKSLPPYARLSTKLHAHFLTSQISNREGIREYESTLHINELLDPIIKAINRGNIDDYKNDSQLYGCINADGIAIITEHETYVAGKTPDKQQIADLVTWLDTRTDSDYYYAVSRLMGNYPGAAAIKDTASGVFFHSLYKTSKQGVLWFRGENKRTISWAGDPEKAIEISKDSLMPRKSFAQWKQVVANSALNWEKPEIDAGIRLATNIQNNIFLTYITKEERKYRLQTQTLEKANAELNNFNYICSHDLQEPIRKIQVFSEMLLSAKESNQVFDSKGILQKINVSAKRAAKQIQDLLELASISNYSDVMLEVNLDDCLEKVKTDLELTITEKNTVFVHGTLGKIKGIPTQIEQLFTNLIGNALKFSTGENHRILISTNAVAQLELEADTPLNPQGEYICLEISDNGIGFNQKFADKIFDIFFRLGDNNSYPGSGIGLAICKKIVDNHKGFIRAKGQKDEGASFYVYLERV